MPGKYRLFLTTLLAIGAALLSPPGRASAHFLDSDLVVDDVPVGPYRLSVWTVATALDDASMHITSRLVDAETGAPVLAARVRYVVEDVQGNLSAIICDAIPASPVNGFLFEGDVPLPQYGSYRVTVEVEDGQSRGGEAVYVFPVYPLSKAMQIFVGALLVIGLAATAWLMREGYFIFFGNRSEL